MSEGTSVISQINKEKINKLEVKNYAYIGYNKVFWFFCLTWIIILKPLHHVLTWANQCLIECLSGHRNTKKLTRLQCGLRSICVLLHMCTLWLDSKPLISAWSIAHKQKQQLLPSDEQRACLWSPSPEVTLFMKSVKQPIIAKKENKCANCFHNLWPGHFCFVQWLTMNYPLNPINICN